MKKFQELIIGNPTKSEIDKKLKDKGYILTASRRATEKDLFMIINPSKEIMRYKNGKILFTLNEISKWVQSNFK